MKRNSQAQPKYFCDTAHYTTAPQCVKVFVEENAVEQAIVAFLQAKLNLINDHKKERELAIKTVNAKKVNYAKMAKQLQTSINNLDNVKFKAYESYTDGKISKDDFQKKKAEVDVEKESLSTKLAEFIQLAQLDEVSQDNSNPLADVLKGKAVFDSLSLEMVENFVEKVIVYAPDNFEIVWKFSDVII